MKSAAETLSGRCNTKMLPRFSAAARAAIQLHQSKFASIVKSCLQRRATTTSRSRRPIPAQSSRADPTPESVERKMRQPWLNVAGDGVEALASMVARPAPINGFRDAAVAQARCDRVAAFLVVLERVQMAEDRFWAERFHCETGEGSIVPAAEGETLAPYPRHHMRDEVWCVRTVANSENSKRIEARADDLLRLQRAAVQEMEAPAELRPPALCQVPYEGDTSLRSVGMRAEEASSIIAAGEDFAGFFKPEPGNAV